MEPAEKGAEASQLTKGRRDSRNDNAEDCPVCMTKFDDTLRRPRNLPCGHTFCTPCINGLKEEGQVTCPTCRITHAVPEAGQFPVSYITEAFMRRLRGAASASSPSSSLPPNPGKDTEESAPSPVPGPGQERPAGLSRPIRSMLQEQEDKVLAAIHTCQEVQAQLDQYQTTLTEWGEQQQNLEDRLQALVDQSKGARLLVQHEKSQAADKKEQLQQGEQQLQALLQALRTVATPQEAFETIDDVDHRIDEERQRAAKCQGIFPDVDTVTTISKVREASSAALEAATTVQAARQTTSAPAGAAKDLGLPTDLDSSITDRLQVLLTPTLKNSCPIYLAPPPLQAKDLRIPMQPIRSLLQSGLVFAVHQKEGKSRNARISLKGDRQYLHSLQDQALPRNAITVQMNRMVPAAPPCLVFLDLKWPRNGPHRVLISLSPNTPLGRQFLLLCTGQQGPCYANTRLLEVRDKGRPGECVFGGDHEYNNGTGGAALVPDLNKGVYQDSSEAGAVWGWWCDPARGALFSITTRECQGRGVPNVFGEVVEGLNVMNAATRHSPITDVIVVDCGVVLWK